jgi:hypothetical protein
LLDQFDAEIDASDVPWLITFCDPTDETGTVVFWLAGVPVRIILYARKCKVCYVLENAPGIEITN